MSRTVAKVIYVVLVVGVLLTTIALAATSSASYAFVNGMVESLGLSSTHRTGLFSPTAYRRIIFNLRCSAFGAFFAAALVFRFRTNTESFICLTLEDFLRFGTEMYRRAAQFVHREVLDASVLLFLCLEGFVIRLRYIFQPVRYDEAFTYLYYARKPALVGISFYSAPNNHVFHTLLVHFAVLLFGNHPWAFRLPAFVAGMQLIPCCYAAFRSLYGREAALLTAAFIAVSAPLVEYSTNARGYMGVCLSFVVLVWLGQELLRMQSLSRWLCFVAVAALGFYTIPTMLYPFAMVVVWLVICASRLRLPTKFFFSLLLASVAALLSAAILYVPVLAVSGGGALFSNRFVQSRSWPYFLSNILPSCAATWRSWNAAIPQLLAIVLLLAFIGGAILERRALRAPGSLLLGIIPVSMLLVAQRVVPFERVWLFLIPLYFGVASIGIVIAARALQGAWLRNSHIIAIAVILVSIGLSVSLIHTNVVYVTNEGKDSEAIAELLKGRLKSGDRVIAEAPYDVPLEYYFDRRMVPTDFLFSDPATSEELFVICQTGHDPESVLNAFSEPVGNGLRSPELIKRFADTSLFEVGRLKTTAAVRNRIEN